jgi:hypothetical protein
VFGEFGVLWDARDDLSLTFVEEKCAWRLELSKANF